jgi:hypothetical protein
MVESIHELKTIVTSATVEYALSSAGGVVVGLGWGWLEDSCLVRVGPKRLALNTGWRDMSYIATRIRRGFRIT